MVQNIANLTEYFAHYRSLNSREIIVFLTMDYNRHLYTNAWLVLENTFCFFKSTRAFFFSRNPVSSDEEAISIKEDDSFLAKAYELALLASGFNKSKGAFKPCPLGTFTNISSEGRDGCLNCPPGNFYFLCQSSDDKGSASGINSFLCQFMF